MSIDGNLEDNKHWDFGIQVGGGTGVAKNIEIKNVTVRDTDNSTLRFVNTDDSRVVDSTFTDGGRDFSNNPAPSVALTDGSQNNVLRKVTVSNQNNGGGGILFTAGSSGNDIVDSQVSNNQNGGIAVFADDTKINRSTTVSSNTQGDGIAVDANRVTIRDTTVEFNARHGIDVLGNNATLTGVTSTDNGYTGIRIDAPDATVVRATVERNNLGNNALGAITVTTNGDRATINGSDVRNNDQGDGIFVRGTNTVLGGNTVVDAPEDGIDVEYPGFRIVNNDVRNNAQDGIEIGDKSNSGSTPLEQRIEDNTVENNGATGILFKNTGLGYRVINNTVENHPGSGIRVVSSDNVFRENTLRNNVVGIELDGANRNVLNNVFRNTTFRSNYDWSVRAKNGAVATFENSDLDFPNADVEFAVEDVRLVPTNDSNEPGHPDERTNVNGVYLSAERTSSSGQLNLTVEYTTNDPPEIEESTISLWYNDGSWHNVTATSVDTVNNVLEHDFTSSNLSTDTVIGPFAAPNRTVADCRTIRIGGTYELDRNITTSEGGPCIEILASDVVLDGKGYTLAGSGAGTGVLVNDSVTNVTVRNLNVREFGTGVQFGQAGQFGVTTGNVTGVNVVNNSDDGVAAYSSTGLLVEDVTARANGRDGIRVVETGAEVRNNSVENSGRYGIVVDGSVDENVVSDNVVRGGQVGIRLSGASQKHTLSNDTVVGSASAGLQFDDAEKSTITNSTVRKATVGVELVNDAKDNQFTDVAVTNSSRWAVVATGSDGNNFTRADLGFANGNVSFTPKNLKVGRETAPPENPRTEEDIGIYLNVTDAGASSELDLTVNYDASVENDVEESRFGLWEYTGSWTNRSSASKDTNSNTISDTGISISGNTILAPLATRTISSCRVIDESGGYEVTENIENGSTTACIEITASNVSIVGQGYEINGTDGDAGSVAVVVASGVDDVNVSDLTLVGFETGVRVESAVTDSTVHDVEVPASNQYVLEGISLSGTTGVTVNRSVVENVKRAVEVVDSSSTTLRDNDLGTSSVGLRIDNSTGFTASNTTLNGNGVGAKLSGSSGTASFQDTVFRNSGNWAVVSEGGITASFANPDLDLSNGNVSFDVVDARLRKTDASNEPAPPGIEGDIGQFLNVTGTSAGASLDLTVNYDYDFQSSSLIEDSLTVWRYRNGGWTDLGGSLDNASDTLTVSLTDAELGSGADPGRVLAPLAADREIDACGTIDDPGNYVLVTDIENDAVNNCLEITVSDVSLDGQYHRIDGVNPGTPSDETRGIAVTNSSSGLKNVTVKNVAVAGFDTGVDLGNDSTTYGAKDSVVRNVLVPGTNASASSTGVSVANSPGATVDNVTVSNYVVGVSFQDSGGTLSDVTVDNATRGVDVAANGRSVELTSVEANDSVEFGIQVTGATEATLSNVRAYGNGGEGVEVGTTSGNASLSSVAVGNNGATGVLVNSGKGFDLTDVRSKNNGGPGVDAAATSGSAALTRVEARNNTGDGIQVDAGDAGLTLDTVTVADNNATGVDVSSGSGAFDLTAVRANGNGGPGVDVTSTGGSGSLATVEADNNDVGVRVDAGGGEVTLDTVTVADNDRAGLQLTSTGSGSSLSNVTARRSGGVGLRLGGGTGGATVFGSTFENNTVGVDIAASADNTRFESATFANNSLWAVDAESDNNTFVDPDLGLPNGSVEFTANHVKLRPADPSAVPAPPGTDGDIDLFLNATQSGTENPSLDLRIDYTFDFSNSELVEESLAVWRNNGTWGELGGTLDTGNRTLNVTLTTFPSPDAYFGPLAANGTITGCGVIDDPGTYTVESDITDASAETCLRITSSDVVVDGKGKTLNGVDGSAGDGGVSRGVLVEGGVSNVTVRDLTVTGFRRGVQVGDGSATVQGATVTGVDVPDDRYDQGGTTVGVGLNDTAGATVENGVFENVTRGLELSGASGTNVTGVTVRNDVVGVTLVGSTDNTFSGTFFRNNSQWAIDASSGSDRNAFTSPNLGIPNGSVSFELDDVRLRAVNDSEAPATRVTEDDIGIFLEAKSDAGRLDLTVNYRDNATNGIAEETLSVWRYNRTGDEWTDLGRSGFDKNANTLNQTVTEFSVIAPLATDRTIDRCGVIDRDGVWKLDSNVTNDSADTCLRITASDAVLNGQGNYVRGLDNDSGSRGIVVANDTGQQSNVTVENVGVSGWGEGVVVSTVGGADVKNVTVAGTTVVGGSTGVLVASPAADVDVLKTTVRDADTGLDLRATGAYVFESTFRNNTVGIAAGDGFDAFRNNTVVENADGVVLEGSDNRFENTDFENNSNWSIRSDLSGSASTAGNNTFLDPQFGFDPDNVSNVSFTVADLNVQPTPDGERPSLSSFPVEKKDVDVYFDLATVSTDPRFDVTVEYERTDPATIEDETLRVWRYNGTWGNPEGSVDEGTDTLTATLGAGDFSGSEPLVFAPLADPARPDFDVTLKDVKTPVVGGGDMVFTINVTNEGDVKGTQNVSVVFNESPASVTGNTVAENGSVELAANTGKTFDLVWSTGKEDDGQFEAIAASQNDSDSTPVEVLAPAKFEVRVKTTNQPVVENRTRDLEVSVTVENTGDVKDTQSIELNISNGVGTVDGVNETIQPGSSKSFDLTWSPDEGQVGNYTAEVSSANTSDSTTVQVYDDQNFQVDITETNLDTIENNDNAIVEGTLFNATVDVTNLGDIDGTQTIRLLRNGTEVANETVTLGGDFEGTDPETKSITLTWQTDEGDAGDYNMTVVSGNDTDWQTADVLDSQNFSVVVTGTNSPDEYDEANVEGGEPVTVSVNVTNTGEVPGTQTLNLTIPGDGSNASVRDNVTVTLEPGESNDSIELVWKTQRQGTTGDAGLYDGAEAATVFSRNSSDATAVRVLDSPYFEVSIESVTEPVVANETMDFRVSVTNTGEVPDEQQITLTVPAGATERDTYNLTLDASLNASETARFDLSWKTVRGDGSPNPYNASVSSSNSTDSRDVRVQRPAELTVVDIVSTNSPVLPNETLEITANISNVGDLSTSQDIILEIGGEVRDSRTVNLEGRDSQLVTFEWNPGSGNAGGYVASVSTLNDSDSRNVSVLAPGATTIELESTNSPVVEGDTLTFDVTVENTGDTQETQLVTLAAGGETRDSRQVTLAGRETKRLTLEWETGPGDAGDYQVNLSTANDSVRPEVRVDAPASFGVTINSTNSAIVENETLTVNATVRNLGDVPGNETVALTVAGEQRDAREVRLAGGENRTVTLSWTTGPGDGGTYRAAVSVGSSNDTTEVTIQRPADLRVSVESVESPVTEGETMTVTAVVRNVGDLAVSRSVVLSIGGKQRDTQRIDVSGNGEVPVTLTWQTGDGDAGNYTAEVTSGGVSDSAEVGVLAPATYSVDVRTVSSTVSVGQQVGATVEIENVGDLAGNQTVTLSVGAVERDNVTVALAPGESTTKTLTWETDEEDQGEHTLYVSSLSDTESFNVSVTPPGSGGGGGTPNQNPTVSIRYAPGSPQRGQGVSFEAVVDDPDGSVEAYQWRINGRPASRSPSFSTTFSASGTYRVSVIVTDNEGANAEATTVVVVNTPPSVSITQSPDSVRVNSETTLSASGSDPDGAIVRYVWRIGETVIGRGPSIDHSFERTGEFRVTVTAIDDDGEATTNETSVVVTANAPPEARLQQEPLNPGVGDTVAFSANAVDSDGEVVEYEWFVDGTRVSTDPGFERTFEEAGRYQVRLVVTDDKGAQDSVNTTVAVNDPPTASIGISNTTPTVNQSVVMRANTTDQIGGVQRIEWRVDGEVVSTASRFDYEFEEPGEHEITLVVTDENGATVSINESVQVQAADVQERQASGVGGFGIGQGSNSVVPILLVLGVLTVLVLYLYVRFRQLAGAEESGDE